MTEANIRHLIALKAKMLCYGIEADEAAVEELRTEFLFDTGFIHGNVLMLDGRFPVNAPVVERLLSRRSPVSLIREHGRWIASDGALSVTCTPLGQPAALKQALGSYGSASDYIRLHAPKVVFIAPIRQCIFGAIGKACKFCTFQMQRVQYVPDGLIVEVVHTVVEQVGAKCDIALGGGTPVLTDYGAAYYGGLAQHLKQRVEGRISVEIVPPRKRASFESMRASGVDAVIMSIEVWDEDRRRFYCPGKGEVSHERYVEAWQEAVEIFGAGQVSSVLLIGLESKESTCEGIRTLIENGVIPTLIPFRPYGACEMSDTNLTDHQLYLRCSYLCSELLNSHGLFASRQAGCTGCGGCSMEVIGERVATLSNEPVDKPVYETASL